MLIPDKLWSAGDPPREQAAPVSGPENQAPSGPPAGPAPPRRRGNHKRAVAALALVGVLGAGGALVVADSDEPSGSRQLPAASGSLPGLRDSGNSVRDSTRGEPGRRLGAHGRRPRAPASSIDSDGTIVTNAHVVGSSQRRRRSASATTAARSTPACVGTDPSTDLAVLNVDASAAADVRPLALADSAACEVGDLASRSATRSASTAPPPRASSPASGARSGAQRLPDRRGHPDRRADQPRQLGRPAARRARPRDRRQLADRQPAARRRQRRHRLRRPVEHRARGRARACSAARRSSAPYLGVSTGRRPPAARGARRRRQVTPAARRDDAGLRAGDVITRVDGARVDEPVRRRRGAIEDRAPGDRVEVEVARDGDASDARGRRSARGPRATRSR